MCDSAGTFCPLNMAHTVVHQSTVISLLVPVMNPLFFSNPIKVTVHISLIAVRIGFQVSTQIH